MPHGEMLSPAGQSFSGVMKATRERRCEGTLLRCGPVRERFLVLLHVLLLSPSESVSGMRVSHIETGYATKWKLTSTRFLPAPLIPERKNGRGVHT
jgi:hypothetical protein